MSLGALRDRIEIQSKSTTTDAGGGESTSWITDETVPGRIKPLRGNEKMRAQQLESSVTHRIRMRWTSTIGHDPNAATKLRLRKKGTNRVFNIRSSVDPDERERFLEIEAEEGVAT